jgi:tetratricopeptide (TPR) repeat protein
MHLARLIPSLVALALVLAGVVGILLSLRFARRTAHASDAADRGDYLGAADWFRQVAHGRPFFPMLRLRARLWAASALIQAGHYEAAAAEIGAIEPRAWPPQLHGVAHRLKATVHTASSRLDDAEREAQLALEHGERTGSPRDIAGAHVALGVVALQRGQLAAAVQHVSPFIAAPTIQNAPGFEAMAEISRVRGWFVAARRWTDGIHELARSLLSAAKRPGDPGHTFRVLALCSSACTEVADENWPSALQYLSALRSCQPMPPKVAALANSLTGLPCSAVPGHGPPAHYFDIAEQICATIPEDTRTRAMVAAYRGKAGLYLRDYDAALTHLHWSLDHGLMPLSYPTAWYHIGLAHEGRGDAAAAREAFERAASAGEPDHLHVRLARERLQSADEPRGSRVPRP